MPGNRLPSLIDSRLRVHQAYSSTGTSAQIERKPA
jgi:hypothetical protein